MKAILLTWLRAGRLGDDSVMIGLGPWELWIGWLTQAPAGFWLDILPGSGPASRWFDFWFDLMIGRIRISLVWLGMRPALWRH